MNDITPIENLIDTLTKSNWIATHGSPELQSIYNAGYECQEAYAIERIKFDYPGFQLSPCYHYDRADSPHPYVFTASLGYPESYCYQWVNTTGLAIDNYLGKYQIFKQIKIPKQSKDKIELGTLIETECLVAVHTAEKQEWILTCGSDELREAYLNGYECELGYIKDRLVHDYPGFEVSKYKHDRTDTPSKHGLATCIAYQDDNAYVCEWGGDEYIYIPNYLNTHPIWKIVEDEIVEYQSTTTKVTIHEDRANHLCTIAAILTAIAIPIMLIRVESQVRQKIPAIFDVPDTLPLMAPNRANPLLFDR